MRWDISVYGIILMLLVTSQGHPTNKNLESEIIEIIKELIELEPENESLRSAVRRESEEEDDDETDVANWLKIANEKLRAWRNRQATVEWNFKTNITDYNSKQIAQVEAEYSAWYPKIQKKARALSAKKFDPDTDRQLRLFRKYANPSNIDDVKYIKELGSNMSTIYSTEVVCIERELCLELEPGLQNRLASSRNEETLRKIWKGWRDATGPKIKPLYIEYVKALNAGARENGYQDYGQYWRDEQFDETRDLEKMCDKLWAQVKPLYLQLHAYVRRKLTDRYGEDIVGTDGTIPAHLLGNMWAQNWQSIASIVFPSASSNNNAISAEAGANLRDNYNVRELFRLSEEFYSSIGLFNMTDIFWKKSMLVKPNDRDVTCHASASDLSADDDFRIKMCTEITMDYLYTIHHEMGHIEYFMAYSKLPSIYHAGANAGFHEAVGDTIALSVIARKHLKEIGLIENDVSSPEDNINDLLYMALSKVAFLPFGYLLDKWRWRVFDESVSPENMNELYWKLRLEYQGIVAPVPRSKDDFDPGAKYHVPANSAYMIYFVSFIVQFQFYESMCNLSNHQGPLHTCDFYRSMEAGTKFREMLELGQSVPWPEALEKLTGSRDLSVEPLMKYFEPLHEWLKQQNEGHKLGWDGANINWRN